MCSTKGGSKTSTGFKSMRKAVQILPHPIFPLMESLSSATSISLLFSRSSREQSKLGLCTKLPCYCPPFLFLTLVLSNWHIGKQPNTAALNYCCWVLNTTTGWYQPKQHKNTYRAEISARQATILYNLCKKYILHWQWVYEKLSAQVTDDHLHHTNKLTCKNEYWLALVKGRI